MFSRICCLTILFFAIWAAPAFSASAASTSLSPRTAISLTRPWRFRQADEAAFSAVDFDDASWSTVTVPHTWNNLDGEDGGNNYLKAACWYRRHFNRSSELAGRALFLRF